MIVLDIETIPMGEEPTMPAVPPIKAPANYKDPEKIKAYIEENAEKHVIQSREIWESSVLEPWKKGALKSVKSQIVCVCAYDTYTGDIFKMASFRELSILAFFQDWLDTRASNISQFLGHNVNYDLQMLFAHACKHDLQILKKILTFEKWPKNIHCTMAKWAGVRTDEKCKLIDIAEFLGLEVKNEIEGNAIYDLYKAGNFAEIEEKCINDVMLTYEVWKRIC